jgi:Fur family peroxide stress response transcriptional regulator
MSSQSDSPGSRGLSGLTGLAEQLQPYEARLRSTGQFVTVQRRAILRYLLRHRTHPTTGQISRTIGKNQSASQATVYNNLALFAELGIVKAIRSPHGDGETHWDIRIDPHHHLSCTKCGQVFDIDYGAAQVSIQESDLARRVEHTQLWLTGRCPPCAAAS